MAFEALQKLGPEKFQKITNAVVTGTPCMAVARMIQQDWGDLTNVAEKTLTQQLSRFKSTLAITHDIKQEVTPTSGKLDIKLLRGSNVSVLAELAVYHQIQIRRVEALAEKELTHPDFVTPQLGDEITRGVEILESIQKIRFDLGQDEFAGPVTGMRGASELTRNPDGSETQKQVFEAFNVAQNILQKRGIKIEPDPPVEARQ